MSKQARDWKGRWLGQVANDEKRETFKAGNGVDSFDRFELVEAMAETDLLKKKRKKLSELSGEQMAEYNRLQEEAKQIEERKMLACSIAEHNRADNEKIENINKILKLLTEGV